MWPLFWFTVWFQFFSINCRPSGKLHLTELRKLLIDLGLLMFWHSIYPRFSAGCSMLDFFTSSHVISVIWPCFVFLSEDGFEWFYIRNLCQNIHLMEFLKALFLVLRFFYCAFKTFLMVPPLLLSILLIPPRKLDQ